jgi:UDP-N-acetylglucosamine:LPS N-acetylglucosamine transferase
MALVEFLYFDAGGGHRSAATAVCEVIARRQLPLQTRMVNVQEILDPIDFVRKFTGVRIQDTYNALLMKGWTFGSAQLLKVLQAAVRIYHEDEVRLLGEHFTGYRPDLVVSMVPHFNRAICESLAGTGTPFVTILTDIADYPPHFWIESQDQFVICGSEKAAQQAAIAGIPSEKIFRTSGMIVHPRFYDPVGVQREEVRKRLGLDPDLATGLIMFGGQGSGEMIRIAQKIHESDLQVQLIFICGHNLKLADKLRRMPRRKPALIQGFTREVPYYMALSDFFVGKPGPGSVSEALLMNLPVIVQRNAMTLPQERYNSEWIQEKQVGVVLRSFAQIDTAIRGLLVPATLERLRRNCAAIRNRAVFEIPQILEAILSGSRIPAGSVDSDLRQLARRP